MTKKSDSKTTSFSLTEPQAKVLKFMVRGHEAGATPTVRDVCAEMGWSSPNAAHQHIRALASKGLVELRGRGLAVRLMPLALSTYGTPRAK